MAEVSFAVVGGPGVIQKICKLDVEEKVADKLMGGRERCPVCGRDIRNDEMVLVSLPEVGKHAGGCHCDEIRQDDKGNWVPIKGGCHE